MPRRAGRPCRFPGCSNVVDGGVAYCDAHVDARPMRWDERVSAARRGYGHRWRKQRLMVLSRNPLCDDPFGVHSAAGVVELATDVHHVVPLASNAAERVKHHESNLMPLCHSCHSRITATSTKEPVAGGGVDQAGGRGDESL